MKHVRVYNLASVRRKTLWIVLRVYCVRQQLSKQSPKQALQSKQGYWVPVPVTGTRTKANMSR